MSLLKRIALAVSARVDRLVGEIENHDAVVEAGLRESRRAFAIARVRQARMGEEGERLRRRLAALRADAAAWEGRALACAGAADGEERALECLRRGKQAAAQAESLGQAWERHVALERRLAQELAAVRGRLESLEHRRALMRSREATAAAATRIREVAPGGGECPDLDQAFERWEIRVSESELGSRTGGDGDAFELGLLAAEERAGLAAELDALKRARHTGTAGEDRHEP